MKLGEKVCVTRLFKGEEKQCFKGSVYLSSTQLMRITLEDAPKKKPGKAESFLLNMSAQAMVQSVDEPKKGDYPGVVYSVSETTVKFNCENCFSKKEWLRIRIEDKVTVKDLKAEVENVIRLNNGICCHICRIIHLPESAALLLSGAYSRTKR